MKTIRLEISEAAFGEIATQVGLTMLTGAFGGAADELAQRVVEALKNNKKVLRLETKEEKKPGGGGKT